jgi:hypothetical protein
MTTVRPFHRSTCPQLGSASWNAAGKVLLAMLAMLWWSEPLSAQSPPAHWLHAGAMPPGAIGSTRLQRGGPLSTYIQPVDLRTKESVEVSVYANGGFTNAKTSGQLVGLLIGRVYRFKVLGVPNYETVEIYPTVELIDRLHPPCGKELRFPVPVELTTQELQMAARSAFVTRVIYVEDPTQALPTDAKGTAYFEANRCDDPLVVADVLGRPIAILRIGSRLPSGQADPNFSYGGPPVQFYDRPGPVVLPVNHEEVMSEDPRSDE